RRPPTIPPLFPYTTLFRSTAALDAETEHALFERYAAAASGSRKGSSASDHAAVKNDGRITILVSHRFSTVRMADLIVVLDGAREIGRARLNSSHLVISYAV